MVFAEILEFLAFIVILIIVIVIVAVIIGYFLLKDQISQALGQVKKSSLESQEEVNKLKRKAIKDIEANEKNINKQMKKQNVRHIEAEKKHPKVVNKNRSQITPKVTPPPSQPPKSKPIVPKANPKDKLQARLMADPKTKHMDNPKEKTIEKKANNPLPEKKSKESEPKGKPKERTITAQEKTKSIEKNKTIKKNKTIEENKPTESGKSVQPMKPRERIESSKHKVERKPSFEKKYSPPGPPAAHLELGTFPRKMGTEEFIPGAGTLKSTIPKPVSNIE